MRPAVGDDQILARLTFSLAFRRKPKRDALLVMEAWQCGKWPHFSWTMPAPGLLNDMRKGKADV